jgi:flagellar hook assembly protein FlgD
MSELRLDPAMPNPARGATSISFSLPRREEIVLRLIDASGRAVRALQSGVMEAGAHRTEWDGRDDSGNRVASGTYWIELSGGSARTSQRLVYLR